MATAEELHARALDRLVDGDVEGGIEDLEAVVALAPDAADAWLHLAQAREVEGRADAEGAFERACAADRGSLEARLGVARARARRGDAAGAEAALDEAALAHPGDARVDLERGLARVERHAYGEAVEPLRRATLAMPDDARAFYALGLASEALRDAGGAVAALRQATRLEPTFTDARRTLADVLAGLGELDAAIAELEAVLGIDRRDEAAAANADALRTARAEREARRLLGKAPEGLAESALAREGGLRPRRARGADATGPALRWGAPGGVEVWIELAQGGPVEALTLVLADPERATRGEDDLFGVTVVGRDGRAERADFGTGVSITFVREALGCSMTTAASLYARLCAGEPRCAWGDATIAFVEASRPDEGDRRPGLEARRAAGRQGA
jgi:tetratricopeptide (TPR) repeat protein